MNRTTLLSLTAAAAICLSGALPGSGLVPSPATARAASASNDAAQWTAIGPNGQAGTIARSPEAPDHAILIPSFGVGPWVTDDAGSTWRQLPDPPGVRNAGDANRVLIDPADPSHWWYAGTAATTAESVLLETHDDGRTWAETARFNGELLSFFRPEAARAGASAGSTSPTGSSSEMILATTTSATTAAVHTRTTGDAWMSRTIDTGEAINEISQSGDALVLRGFFAMWRLDLTDDDASPVEIYRVSAESRRLIEADPALAFPTAADADDEPLIWDATTTPSVILVKDLGRGLVGSTDGGSTWSEWNHPNGVASMSSEGDAIYLVRAGAGPRTVDITTDAGATFTEMSMHEDGSVGHQFTTWADGSITASHPRSGLYRTTDGGTRWERVGVQGTSGLDLLTRAATDRLFAATEYGLAATDLPVGGSEWGATGGEARVGSTVADLATAGDGEAIWKAVNAAFDQLKLYSSTDEGSTWQDRSTMLARSRALMAHPADADLVISSWESGDRCGLRSTTDGGATWSMRSSDCFDAIVGDPNDPDRVWFGGPAGLFRSDDGGATGVLVSDRPATTILLDKHRIVIGGDDIYTSEDDGATFTKSDQPATMGAAGPNFTSLVRSGPRIFAGFTTGSNVAGSGVLLSSDGGRTWADFSTGIQNSEVLSLAISADGGSLFAGTRDGGVHTTALPPRLAPTAVSDSIHTRSGEPVRIDVLGNDSGGDLDIDPGSVVLRSGDDGAGDDATGDGPIDWSSSVTVPGQGSFEVDATTGAVVFTPDSAFVGTTGTIHYRFANTDGETAEAGLSVVVDAATVPGGGDSGDSGAGGHGQVGTGGPDAFADTGVNALVWAAGALALLVIGAALSLRSRFRRRTATPHDSEQVLHD
ncbi:Ig-like domain-containing protein [Plantibacter sp. YIM 135347]|uniref:Ig-like domain-containing protein n=1 Tax=Plantibacter sp. YIM 135347 TaxID=3423919 RepID=UPI003D32B40A